MMYFEFASLYVLWVFYLAVMNLKRARDAGTLTEPALVLGMPVLILGYAIDILVNVVVATVLFPRNAGLSGLRYLIAVQGATADPDIAPVCKAIVPVVR